MYLFPISNCAASIPTIRIPIVSCSCKITTAKSQQKSNGKPVGPVPECHAHWPRVGVDPTT